MAATKRNVGYIGVGLMGHGAARNILEKGHALAVLGNRNRASALLNLSWRYVSWPRGPGAIVGDIPDDTLASG